MALPYAPIPLKPVGGDALYNGADQTFRCRHSDPDGDGIQAGEMQLRQGGTTTWATYPASLLDVGNDEAVFTVASGEMTPEGEWETRFRTSDPEGYGPWSAVVFFTAFGQPATPVITSSSTIGSSPFDVTWTAANQDAFQVQRLADNAGSPGTVLATSAVIENPYVRTRSIAFPVTPATEHVQVRVRYAGVWSEWASQQVTVNYSYPSQPVVDVDDITMPHPAIRIAVTNPSGGSTVTSNTIHRQQSIDGQTWTDKRGTPDADDRLVSVGADGTHTDDRLAHLMRYRYQVQAVSDTGASRNTGQLSYAELTAQYPTYTDLEAAFSTYWEMQGSWTE